MSSPSTSMEFPSLQELMDNLQTMINTHRTPNQPKQIEMEPSKPYDWTCRQTSQDIAAFEICLENPKYMVIGTYSLVKKDDDKEYPSQFRRGELLIMPVANKFNPSYPGQLPPSFDRHQFSSAILDLHFHPSDPTLLGIATSNAQMHFYRFVQHADVIGRQVQLKLLPLGSVTVAPNDQHGLVPLITQFTWLSDTATSGKTDKSDQQSVALIATTSLNEVILVRCTFPAIRKPFDGRLALETSPVTATTINFPSHSLEAWCVAASLVKTSEDLSISTLFVLSGGDDSALIASLIELGPIGSTTPDDPIPAQHLFTETKSHSAGVTAILPLTPIKITDDPIRSPSPYKYVSPILTGSYDERLRLFIYDPTTSRKTLITEVSLKGGVWRLKLMDTYLENPRDFAEDSSSSDPVNDGSTEKRHFLILASCMHAGVRIVRLTHRPSYHSVPDDAPERAALVANVGWTLEVVGKFTAGHESMVYCCDFRREGAESDAIGTAAGSERGPGAYTVVSTSFYDRQVCVWGFVDEVKKALETRALKEEVRTV